MRVRKTLSYKDRSFIGWVWKHDDMRCPTCDRDMSNVEVYRSGHGIEGGRYMKFCPTDGYMYYNLGKEIGK